MFELPPQVSCALQELNRAGFEAYLVGGGVRDELMGLPPKDYDITTSALPEQTKRVFDGFRLIDTGIKHGTVTVLIGGIPLEITTFRVDGKYSDFRHPDDVCFSPNLEDDLARRDFTVNALAYHPVQGLVDCFGGQKDLQSGLIRCVGSPAERFREDALRILRAIRFSSVLGFHIEAQTAAATHSQKDLLRYVSAERIYSEFSQLLCGKNVRAVLEEYIDVLGVFLPLALEMPGCPQNCRYHCYDVLSHTAHAVEAIQPDPVLRFAAFFHDIGKPACRSTDADGTDHFYGHAERSAEIAEASLKALRADAKTVHTVSMLVRYHDIPIEQTERSVKRALRKLTADGFRQILALKRADTAAHAPVCHGRLADIDALMPIAEEIIRKDNCFSLKQLAVNGSDLLSVGVPNGRQVGIILNYLLEAVLDDELPNDKAALLCRARELLAEQTDK